MTENKLTPKSPDRVLRIIHLGILMILVGVVFGNVLSNGFVWDDVPYLVNIEAYRSLDFRRFFFKLGNGMEYLPIRDVSFALDFALWGNNPAGFHATNLIIYALSVVAVYLFVLSAVTTLKTTGNDAGQIKSETIAFWSSAIFALHPIHCEPVNFIVGGRNTLLAGLFVFLSSRSFILYLGDIAGSHRLRLATAFCWYVFAIFSKATAVSLPLFFIMLCLIVRGRSLLTRIASIIPFIAVSCIVFKVYTSIATQTGTLDPFIGAHMSPVDRISIIARIPFFYLDKLLVPTGFSVDYSLPSFPGGLSLAVACILLALMALLAFYCRTRFQSLYLAICWYLIILLPVIQLVSSPMPVADRYAYLPSFAFCFLAAYCLSRSSALWPRTVTVVASVILCGYGVLSFEQNRVWKSNLTLWEHTLAVSPKSLQSLNNLGTYYYITGNYDRAFNLFNRAQQIEPTNPIYDFFSGHHYYVRNHLSSATGMFEKALVKKYDLIDALFYMAEINEQQGNIEKARSYYQRVIVSRDLDRGDYKRLATERLRQIY